MPVFARACWGYFLKRLGSLGAKNRMYVPPNTSDGLLAMEAGGVLQYQMYGVRLLYSMYMHCLLSFYRLSSCIWILTHWNIISLVYFFLWLCVYPSVCVHISGVQFTGCNRSFECRTSGEARPRRGNCLACFSKCTLPLGTGFVK